MRLPQRPADDPSLLLRMPYLAPEQLVGEATSAATDVFTLGVLAYELLGGRRPFEGQTFSEISYKLLYEEPSPLSEAWPECPPGLEALVHRCLRKSPDERYSGLGELLADLEPALERPRRPAHRRRRSAWLLPLAAGGVALAGAGVGRARAAEQERVARRLRGCERDREVGGVLGDLRVARLALPLQRTTA